MSSKKTICFLLGMLGIATVAWVDYVTGIEARFFPIYFIPLVLGAWGLGYLPVAALCVVAAGAWTLSLASAGQTYSSSLIWVLNFGSQMTAFLLVSLLVVRLRSLLQREKQFSRTDPLTGILNSRGLYETGSLLLEQCRKASRPLTVAYLDLDNFKRVNDRLGHQAGDELLRLVAASLREREKEWLPARVGGDEFVVLMPGISEATAPAHLLKMKERLEIRASKNEEPPLAVSIGAVTYDRPPASLDSIISQADNLMYDAKRNGKDCLKTVHLTEAAFPEPGEGSPAPLP